MCCVLRDGSIFILLLHVMNHPRALPCNDASRKFPFSQGEIKQGIPQGGRDDTSFNHSKVFLCLVVF